MILTSRYDQTMKPKHQGNLETLESRHNNSTIADTKETDISVDYTDQMKETRYS